MVVIGSSGTPNMHAFVTRNRSNSAPAIRNKDLEPVSNASAPSSLSSTSPSTNNVRARTKSLPPELGTGTEKFERSAIELKELVGRVDIGKSSINPEEAVKRREIVKSLVSSEEEIGRRKISSEELNSASHLGRVEVKLSEHSERLGLKLTEKKYHIQSLEQTGRSDINLQEHTEIGQIKNKINLSEDQINKRGLLESEENITRNGIEKSFVESKEQVGRNEIELEHNKILKSFKLDSLREQIQVPGVGQAKALGELKKILTDDVTKLKSEIKSTKLPSGSITEIQLNNILKDPSNSPLIRGNDDLISKFNELKSKEKELASVNNTIDEELKKIPLKSPSEQLAKNLTITSVRIGTKTFNSTNDVNNGTFSYYCGKKDVNQIGTPHFTIESKDMKSGAFLKFGEFHVTYPIGYRTKDCPEGRYKKNDSINIHFFYKNGKYDGNDISSKERLDGVKPDVLSKVKAANNDNDGKEIEDLAQAFWQEINKPENFSQK